MRLIVVLGAQRLNVGLLLAESLKEMVLLNLRRTGPEYDFTERRKIETDHHQGQKVGLQSCWEMDKTLLHALTSLRGRLDAL